MLYDQEFTDMLDNLFNKWIKKCLTGEHKCIPWWEAKGGWEKNTTRKELDKTVPFLKHKLDTFSDSCGRDALMHKIGFGTDSITFQAYWDTINWKIENVNFHDDTYMNTFWNKMEPKLMEIINLDSEKKVTSLRIANAPKIYANWEGRDGFMGWHTNADKPGFRYYLVYNTEENSSCVKFYDIENDKINIIYEPKGWSLNKFKLGDIDNPIWHCIHTTGIRFSFGFKHDYPKSDIRAFKMDSTNLNHFNTTDRERN